MPISPALNSLLTRSLQNSILSRKEIRRIETELKSDGDVTPEEVKVVVDSLVQAVDDGLELDTPNRRKRLNKLLSMLDGHHDIGLASASTTEGMSYLDAITARLTGGTTDPVVTDPVVTDPVVTDPVVTDPVVTDPVVTDPVVTDPVITGPVDLAKKSFGGKDLQVQAGELTLDGTIVPLDLAAPTNAHLDALVALAKPTTLAPLSDDDKSALATNLIDMIASTWPIPADGDVHAFKRAVATTSAVAALRQLAPQLSASDVDNLLAAAKDVPNPMATTQLLAVFDGATLSGAQKTKVDAIEVPEHRDALLQEWDGAAKDGAKVGYTRVSGEMQKTFLETLVFSKKPTSIENAQEGLKTYAKLNPAAGTFDDDEGVHAHNILEGYVNKHGSLAYVYGTFASDAPRNVAVVHNERLVATLSSALDPASSSPNFSGVPLTKEQAVVMREVLGGLENESAANKIVEALSRAATLDSPTMTMSWRTPAAPTSPLTPAAFSLFERIARPFVRDREGTDTGMVDVTALNKDVRSAVDGIREKLQPRLASLGQTPPSWNGVEVGPATADRLKFIAANHVKSGMSVDNLDRAIAVFAKANGGSLKGIAEQRFTTMVDDYQANWPDAKTFDYNKLERIARFSSEGNVVPLATIEGKPVGLAKFYGEVAAKVTGAIDKSVLRHEWIADRWGFRGREAVELLDVIAEQTARGEGPINRLRSEFPGADVSVDVIGAPGAHEQFLYRVTLPGRKTQTFNQASDGMLSPYRGRTQFPTLFSADIRDDGSLHVDVPTSIRTYKYPTQSTYTIGDSIDVPYRDTQATEVRTEGEKFDTRSKIVEGTITGYSASGRYTVEYKKPGSTDVVTKEMSQSEIRKANHPHFFKEDGSYLRDVTIDLTRDQPLREFLEGADTLIAKHLPVDGSMANMDASTLAEHQQNAMKDLMQYAADNMKYPNADGKGAEDTRYRELDDTYRFPLGELVKINRGVCRHQCILYHLLLQRAGIDSRLASGAANTTGGDYRGLHLWVETTLADGSRFLSDQTWKDEAIPLWAGAYDRDKRRLEIASRTTDFDHNLADG